MEKPKMLILSEKSADIITAELHPEEGKDGDYGSIIFEFDNLRVSLDQDMLGEMLLVLRDKKVSMDDCRGCMWNDTAILSLTHVYDPASKYILTLKHVDEDKSCSLELTSAQACGIEAAISGAMVYVAFGIPKYY